MNIYVASSWRNEYQPMVVRKLREAGHEVYDFKNPREGDNGFHWSDIDVNWETWSAETLIECLNDPIAIAGYKSDFEGLDWADVIVAVMPFGRSASLELGWGVGAGKKTILILDDGEPELMIKMVDHIVCSVQETIEILRTLS